MSLEESKMPIAKNRLLGVIKYLSRTSKYGFNNIERFYTNSYELARLIRLHPAQFQLSANEKEEFRCYFPQALKNALKNTATLYHALSPDSLNIMRAYRSKIAFVKEDIFELYENVANSQVSSEMEECIRALEGEELLLRIISRDGLRLMVKEKMIHVMLPI